MTSLWPHQLAAADAVDEKLETHRSTLVVAATGTGKTTTGGEIVRRWQRYGRALWIANREELVRQAAKRMAGMGLRVGIEMAGERVDDLRDLDVVVGTVQSLSTRKRLAKFNPDDFALLVPDEAHHSVAATWRRVIDHFPQAKVVGLTATPDRGDGVAMGRLFESTAHVYGIRDGIRDGFLCRVKQKAVEIEGFDLREVRTTAGDLNEGDLERLLLDPDLLQRIAGAIVEAAGDRKTMVFCVTVAHAHALAATLNGFEPESARALDGGSDGELRRQTLQDFADDKFMRLCNCQLFTEGFDEPSISCVAVTRPTKSRALYCLDEHTEILTPTGWATIGSKPDVVAAYIPETGVIEWQSAMAHIERDLDDGERWIEYEGPAVNFRVTDQHRMIFDRRRKQERPRWKIEEAAMLLDARDMVVVPVAGQQMPVGDPLIASREELLFVGLVMTDGSINPVHGQIRITQSAASSMVAEIDRILDAIGVKYTRSVVDRRGRGMRFEPTAPTVSWTISRGRPRGRGRDWQTGWGVLAVAPLIGKAYTPDFERLEREQVRALLDGLHIGDGVKLRRRGWKICIGKKRRAWCDALQSLCLRRGFHANVLEDVTALLLSVTDTSVRSVPTTVKGRSVVRVVDAPGRCWCVEVPSGAIVVRRNGRSLVVGNCQMVGRGFRVFKGKADCLILDFQGNAGKHTLACPIDILGGADVDPAVKKKAAAAMAERPDLDLLTALEMAARELAAERRAKALSLAQFRAVDVDPFELADAVLGVADEAAENGDAGALADNLRYLAENAGGLRADAMKPSQVAAVAGALKARQEAGRATWAQMRCLQRAGLDPDVDFETAAEAIRTLAATGWQATPALRARIDAARVRSVK